MAQPKAKKTAPRKPSTRPANAPCAQAFNVNAKPSAKKKTWWNGYSQKPKEVEAA